MMDISIREHIINNFHGDDFQTLKKAIDEAVKNMDEVTLPGLGVFLEIIWEDAWDARVPRVYVQWEG